MPFIISPSLPIHRKSSTVVRWCLNASDLTGRKEKEKRFSPREGKKAKGWGGGAHSGPSPTNLATMWNALLTGPTVCPFVFSSSIFTISNSLLFASRRTEGRNRGTNHSKNASG